PSWRLTRSHWPCFPVNRSDGYLPRMTGTRIRPSRVGKETRSMPWKAIHRGSYGTLADCLQRGRLDFSRLSASQTWAMQGGPAEPTDRSPRAVGGRRVVAV